MIPPPDLQPTADLADSPTSYVTEDQSRHARQIVLTLPPKPVKPPTVVNLLTSDPILYTSWAATVLYMPGEPPGEKKPVVFAKVSEIKDLVKNQPVTCAFAFYRLEKGGIFQILIQVDTPEIRAKAKSPYIVEFSRNLDDPDICQLIKDLINRDRLELCFVGPEPGGPCTGYFALEFELPHELKAALMREFDSLLKYHRSLPQRNYEAALDQYNRENPLETSPILALEKGAAGCPAAKLAPASVGLIAQTALANALFIAVLIVIAVVVFWLMTKEGAIFEFLPAERAKDMALWFPGLEAMVISLLVAAVWSWMFRIWSFIANFAACFLCLWGYQTLVFYLGVHPIISGFGSCLAVTSIFWLVSYIRTSRAEILLQASEPEPVNEPQASPTAEVTIEAAPAEAAAPAAEAQPLVIEAAQPLPVIPPPVDVPKPAREPAAIASPPTSAPKRSRGSRIVLIALALAIVFAVIIVIEIIQGAGDRLPAAGSSNPGHAPSGCRLWNEISVADAGQTVCVTGVVERAYLGGELTYIRFSGDPDAFRLVNVNGVDFTALVGQCVMTEGVVEAYGQMPYIEIGDQLDLCDE